MGETTGIGWTDHTANFWMGCQHVSPGCEHCYAETLVTTRMRLPVWGPPKTTTRQRTKSAWTDVPKWNRAAKRDGVRRKVFVSSLADVFEDHPQVAPWRAEALDLLAQCDGLDVQLLTKRPENILAMVPPEWFNEWPAHVWVGTTVEDQRRAEERIPALLNVPAPVRFLSCEPLLERVDLTRWLGERYGCGGEVARLFCEECRSALGLQWVIVGGESGVGARPFDLAWARSIVSQCRDAGVPCFVKQMGANAIDSAQYDVIGPSGAVHYVRAVGDDALAREAASLPAYSTRAHSVSRTIRDRAGADPSEWPADLRVQEFPC